MENNTPLVSVVVPIYNAEDYLHRCLDSLLFQTLEDIEILAINNGSTDGTLEILEKYKTRFPEKLKVITVPHAKRAGRGRNVGVKLARGKYIAFCDSDDAMEFHALERMYNVAKQKDYDCVYSPFYIGDEQNMSVIYRLDPTNISVPVILKYGNLALWNKLYHRRLFDYVSEMPEDFGFEDCAFVPALLSYAKSIGYQPEPVYYYYIRENSEVNSVSSIRMIDVIKAMRWHYEHSNPSMLPFIMAGDARRTAGDVMNRWRFADAYISFLKEILPQLEKNSFFKTDHALVKKVRFFTDLTDEPMQNIVYLNGFMDDYSEADLQELKNKAFYDTCEVYVLNEDTCDLNSVPAVVREAHEMGKNEFVGQYFALQRIYETGGIYLDKRIEIHAPFNFMRYLNSFWSYKTTTEFSGKIFGGRSSQKIVSSLLDTYKVDFYPDRYAPLEKRIKNILLIEYAIPMDGQTNIFGREVSVFAPDTLLIDLHGTINFNTKPHFSKYCYSENDENVELVDMHSIQALIRSAGMSSQAMELVQQNRALVARLNELEHSFTWRLGLKVKMFLNAKPWGVKLKNFIKRILSR